MVVYHDSTKKSLVPCYSNIRITRHKERSKSCVHFFSSHFVPQLKSQGANAIARWTSNINIFTKKIIIVPVFEDHHWSLCSVVNPGSILNVQNIQEFQAKKCKFLVFLLPLKRLCHLTRSFFLRFSP